MCAPAEQTDAINRNNSNSIQKLNFICLPPQPRQFQYENIFYSVSLHKIQTCETIHQNSIRGPLVFFFSWTHSAWHKSCTLYSYRCSHACSGAHQWYAKFRSRRMRSRRRRCSDMACNPCVFRRHYVSDYTTFGAANSVVLFHSSHISVVSCRSQATAHIRQFHFEQKQKYIEKHFSARERVWNVCFRFNAAGNPILVIVIYIYNNHHYKV